MEEFHPRLTQLSALLLMPGVQTPVRTNRPVVEIVAYAAQCGIVLARDPQMVYNLIVLKLLCDIIRVESNYGYFN